MPRKTAEEMFATQGYIKQENSDRGNVNFRRRADKAVYDIYINDQGGVDTHYAIQRGGTRFWGTFQIKDVALKRCIKRYREELKCKDHNSYQGK